MKNENDLEKQPNYATKQETDKNLAKKKYYISEVQPDEVSKILSSCGLAFAKDAKDGYFFRCFNSRGEQDLAVIRAYKKSFIGKQNSKLLTMNDFSISEFCPNPDQRDENLINKLNQRYYALMSEKFGQGYKEAFEKSIKEKVNREIEEESAEELINEQ